MFRLREASCCEKRGIHYVRPIVQVDDQDGCTCEIPEPADRFGTLVDLRLNGGLGGLTIQAHSYLRRCPCWHGDITAIGSGKAGI
jgi:hypothetical protein